MTKTEDTAPEILDLRETKSCSSSGHIFPLLFIFVILGIAGWNFRQEITGFLEQQPSIVRTTEGATSLNNKLFSITQKIDDLALRIEALEQIKTAKADEETAPKTVTPAPSATNAARLETEVAALTQAISTLQEQIKQTNESVVTGQKSALLSLVNSLDILSQTGKSFLPEYTFIRQATANNSAVVEVLSQIEPFAASGVPSLEMLKKEFAQKSLNANTAILKAKAETWYERLWIEAQQLVTIRTLHSKKVDGADLSAIADALEKKNLGDAVTKIKDLPEAGRSLLVDWMKQAEARIILETTMTDLSRLLSK